MDIMPTKLIVNLIGQIRDKTHAFLLQELASHDMKGIAPSHGDILWALYTNEELSMKRLAEVIGRDKSTVTALVNKLIRFEYVAKRTDLNDSRVNLISITEKGKEVKKDVLEISQTLQQKAYKGLSEEEKITLVKLLEKIYHNF
jgi:DNA-binding MarR family transcriptional regulator